MPRRANSLSPDLGPAKRVRQTTKSSRGSSESGARPALGEVVRRADAQLGLRAEVLAGGPDVLLEGLEDRLGGRAVERMTWSM